ncbi:DUF2505 domain-containing protein [Rhodococcus sp. ACPA4]|jgi:uncharacterized protein YndB with AHSA1/START domain|uniref:Uncharacterized protein YndB with AHSA1/START domain n=1 Tax=Nocardia globerula TaxID=1818 RepID=A0A652YTK7_NOCGL|nr:MULTISPECIES: DUF2505 domain-containing protein [Rhodococcus]NMD61251.1 DUF2505 domain-containing protein [Nocardia globerula]MCE4262912.1 DUF2505 domain-containing protein [Rhodococcus globerulus]MDV8068754.1 DUF2505 domain-containing protein [Rhodococcus sp. IEGM 1366]NRI68831.1 DUF2505 domain-containing protein [Rhodococcus sp. MS16]PBC37802.1 DUF2505 domain-containing protein [Rhodococcus sp. ACPA4]
MSKSFRFGIEFNFPPEKVHAALTDTRYWMIRLGDLYSKAVIEDGGGAIAVSLTDELESSALPGLVAKLVPDRLGVERADRWGPLSDGRAVGSVTGRAHGLPIRIEVDLELAEAGDARSVLNVDGWAEVKIPVLGGQIERLLKNMAQDLLRRDHDAVEAFLLNP